MPPNAVQARERTADAAAPPRRRPLEWLASAAALAGVCLLALPAAFDGAAGGASDDERYELVLDGPAWAEPAIVAAAAALLVAAALVWTAERRARLAVALLALAVAVAAGAYATWARFAEGRVTDAQVRSVPLGASEDAVRELLGPRAGHGTLDTRRGSLACDVYVDTVRPAWERGRYLLCFRDGRLIAKRTR